MGMISLTFLTWHGSHYHRLDTDACSPRLVHLAKLLSWVYDSGFLVLHWQLEFILVNTKTAEVKIKFLPFAGIAASIVLKEHPCGWLNAAIQLAKTLRLPCSMPHFFKVTSWIFAVTVHQIWWWDKIKPLIVCWMGAPIPLRLAVDCEVSVVSLSPEIFVLKNLCVSASTGDF